MKLQTAKTILRYAKQYIDLGQLRVAQTKEDWVYLNHEKNSTLIGSSSYCRDCRSTGKFHLQPHK